MNVSIYLLTYKITWGGHLSSWHVKIINSIQMGSSEIIADFHANGFDNICKNIPFQILFPYDEENVSDYFSISIEDCQIEFETLLNVAWLRLY